jgi:2-iminobutanoate/2-iminopropanoate deaminase
MSSPDDPGRGMRTVETPDAPAHVGPVPQAVQVGGWVFVSALFGTDPRTGEAPAEAREEADLLFRNLTAILAAAGTELGDVVRVGVFMKSLQRDRPVFNEVWVEHFGEHRPARSAVGVNDFGRPGSKARFMIEAIAYRS